MDFPISYTGKNVTPEINFAQGLSQASNAAQQKLLGAEQMKLNKALQDEQFVMQETTTPVIQFSSPAAMQNQLNLIEGFKKKWGQRMSKDHGMLSVKDKAELLQDKQNLQSIQKKYLANDREVQRELNILNSDKAGDYNKEHANQVYSHYYKTGELVGSLLSLNPRDTVAHFQKYPLLHGETETVDINGKRVTRFKDPKQGYDYYLSTIYSDDRFLKDLVNKFSELDPKIQQKYLKEADGKNKGVIDEGEKQNAIVAYGWDLNKSAILHEKSVPITKGQPKAGYGYTYSAMNKTINYNPSPLITAKFTSSPKYEKGTTNIIPGKSEEFHYFRLSDIPEDVNIQKGESTWGNDPDKIYYGGLAKGEVVGYDPEKDKFVVRLTRVGDKMISKNTIVLKSADELGDPDLYTNYIKFKNDKGKYITATIGDYIKNYYKFDASKLNK